MSLEASIVDRINASKYDVEDLVSLIFDFLREVRTQILQRFYREEMNTYEKKFCEFLLVETSRTLFNMIPFAFYAYYNSSIALQDILKLKYLNRLDIYLDFSRKRRRLHFDQLIKRNLRIKDAEIYVLDTSIVDVDLNKYRKGKDIKKGKFEAEFIHSTSKGTVVGFILAVLINLSNLSIVELNIYPKTAKKRSIWQEMVLDQIGSISGKIKVVIADAGFFAYDNYLFSPNMRIIPVIKLRSNINPEKLANMMEKLPPNIFWWDKRYNKMHADLLDEFSEIIKLTIENLEKYDGFAKLRSEIEVLFKISKKIFGLENIHTYYRKFAVSKAFLNLYFSSLLYQYFKLNNLNVHRVIGALTLERDLY